MNFGFDVLSYLSGSLDDGSYDGGDDLLTDNGGGEVLGLGDFGVDSGGEGARAGLHYSAGDKAGGGYDGHFDSRVALHLGGLHFGGFVQGRRRTVSSGRGRGRGGRNSVAPRNAKVVRFRLCQRHQQQ